MGYFIDLALCLTLSTTCVEQETELYVNNPPCQEGISCIVDPGGHLRKAFLALAQNLEISSRRIQRLNDETIDKMTAIAYVLPDKPEHAHSRPANVPNYRITTKDQCNYVRGYRRYV